MEKRLARADTRPRYLESMDIFRAGKEHGDRLAHSDPRSHRSPMSVSSWPHGDMPLALRVLCHCSSALLVGLCSYASPG